MSATRTSRRQLDTDLEAVSSDDRPRALARAVHRVGSLPQALLVPVSLVILLALWEGAVWISGVETWMIPAPSKIAVQLYHGFSAPPSSRASYLYHWTFTMQEALIGYVIGSLVGLFFGTLIAQSKLAEKVVFPYLVAVDSTPKLAIAPVLIIWFGLGMESKVVLVALVVFFPVMINSISGFKSVDSDVRDLMRAYRASRWQTFRYVELQSALPFIFAGLQIGIVSSLLAAIVAEFVGGQRGLGVYIVQRGLFLDTAGIFAALVVLSVTGVVLLQVSIAVRRWVIFWSSEEVQARRGR